MRLADINQDLTSKEWQGQDLNPGLFFKAPLCSALTDPESELESDKGCGVGTICLFLLPP